MLTCPICDAPLTLDGRTWRCPAGHAFDRAREGYVDLLPVGHGRTGVTGDTRAMARARARFLGRGHYDRLLHRIIARVSPHLPPAADPPVAAEAGCGVGSYIGGVARALPGVACFGFDVSREALRVAARAHPRVTFATNDVHHRLCLPDASVDALLDVFAPRSPREFRRVLRPGGVLVVVIPGARHLAELRSRLPLLGIQPEKRERTVERLGDALEPAWEEPLEWEAELGDQDVADLVAMGPSAFHLPDDARHFAEAARVTLSFVLLGFRARGRPAGR